MNNLQKNANTLNINDADLIKTIDYINSLKPDDDTEDYELFSEKELDMLYENCLKEIREYLGHQFQET